MGAWGTGILQNDTTADIWEQFKEYYNKGLSPKDIRIKLEKEYKPQKDEEYYGEIWTGIAHGQWMCGELEDYTFKKVKEATNEKWLTLWAEDKKLLMQRLSSLNEFIEKIQTPRPNPLKRKRVVERPAFFKKGDIIGIKVNEHSYLAALATAQNHNPTFGENTVLLTDLLFQEKPTIDEILNADVLYLDIGGRHHYHRSFFRAIFSAKNMSKKIKDTIKIGEVEAKDYLSLGVGTGIGDWNKIGELYNEQLEFLKANKTEKPFSVTVFDIINPKKQLEDKLIEWDKKIWREELERRRQNAT